VAELTGQKKNRSYGYPDYVKLLAGTTSPQEGNI